MTDKKKAARLDTGAASKTTLDSRHDTKAEGLAGWYSLGAGVKPSRTERTPKKSWRRKNQGRIDPILAAQLCVLAVIGLLIFGGAL
jgi:hypothetical protein